MPIATECPLCATKGQVPDSYSGKRVKCPQCCNLFTVTGGSGSSSGTGKPPGGNGTFQRAGAKTQPDMSLPSPGIIRPNGSLPGVKKPGNSFQGTPKPGSNPGNARVSTGSNAGNARVSTGSNAGNARLSSGSNAGNVRPTGGSHPGGPARKSLSEPDLDARAPANLPALLLGILGILLGLVGLTLSLVPDLESFGWPISALGLLMALGGLGLGIVRFRGFGFPIMGILASGGALALAFAMPGPSPDDQKKKAEEQAARELAKLIPTKIDIPTQLTNTKKTPPTTKKYVPPPPMDEWTDASKGFARLGDVRVRVTGVEVGPVKGKDGKVIPKMEKQLSIRMQIENGSVNKKLNYRGAADPGSRTGDSAPKLMDSLGGNYKPFSQGPPVVGQLAKSSVDPSKSVNDLLIFPPPPDRSQYLRLELPGAQFGATGTVKIQIPSSMVVVRATLNSPDTDPKSIDSLRQALKDKDKNVRLNAVNRLGDVGPKAAPAVPDLALALKDPDPALREASALALGKLGATAKGAVPGLIAALKDAQAKVRAQAAQALGQLGADARPAVSALVSVFGDPDDDVAAKAYQAVKRIETPAPKK